MVQKKTNIKTNLESALLSLLCCQPAHRALSLSSFQGGKRLPLRSAEGTRLYYFSSPGKITQRGERGERARRGREFGFNIRCVSCPGCEGALNRSACKGVSGDPRSFIFGFFGGDQGRKQMIQPRKNERKKLLLMYNLFQSYCITVTC